LIDGQLTTDEFTNLYWKTMRQSSDLGVAEIALYGWGLYSDDLIRAHLTGENAITPTDRRIVERCLQFLRTDLEFSWPKTIHHWLRPLVVCLLASVAAAPGLLIGSMLLIAVAINGFRDVEATVYVLLAALAMLLISALILWGTYRYERAKQKRDLQEYRRAGDWDVWPFHTFAEYSAMVSNSRLSDSGAPIP
jgi:hypothetical protein